MNSPASFLDARQAARESARLPRDRQTWVYYRDLILVLLGKEFKVRYKSTFMGYAWSLMHPLAFALILFAVFKVVMRLDVRAYSLYLIAGLFPWQWISNTVISANFYFLGNASLIKKVRFHRATLVLAGVLNELAHFIISIPVILAVMAYFGRYPSAQWLWALPMLLVVQLLMTFGLGLVVATSNLFFRDLERLSIIGMQLCFYLTPIIYTADKVPPAYRWALLANPFAPIILCWQGLFYGGSLPAQPLLAAWLWALAWLAAGVVVYRKNVWRFAEIV